jgi:stage II sporulation protein GA (sporulation sigma-E factor processing peptidase)
MQLYLNLVMGLNFLVDLLLLIGADRMCGGRSLWGRAAFAAVLGGLYSGVCLLPRFHFLGNVLYRLGILGLMGLTAFAFDPGWLRRSALFVFLSLTLSGVAAGIRDGGLPLLLMGGTGVAAMYLLGLVGGTDGREFIPVELCRDGRCIRFFALRDTGNTLHDPVTGQPVLVAGADIGSRLLGLTGSQLEHPVETVASGTIRGLRLIPFKAVGCPDGLLVAIRLEDTLIGDKRGSAVVAFAPQVLRKDGLFQALAGGAA